MGRIGLGGLVILAIAASSCKQSQQPPAQPKIEVRGAEQERLHKLDALQLAIALKRAIFDLGYTCQRVERAGFVGKYENLDMWTAHCSDGRDWAIFAAPDGSAQARDCKDLAGSGVPGCTIKELPKGSFDQSKSK